MSQREFSDEELKALEAEMEKVTVDDVLLQTIVTLINLGARKAGMAAPPDSEPPQPDLEQLRQAIDGARALLPLVEERHADKLGPVRDSLSALQMEYAQQAGGQPAPAQTPDEPEKPQPGEPGPAQRSGKLWIPGQ